MDWKIELEAIPVTDVDRAKAFYVDQVGFNADHDHRVSDTLRFVQLTPPGSACSIVMGTGITEMAPGSQKGVQIVVADVEAARKQLIDNGVPLGDYTEPEPPHSPPRVLYVGLLTPRQGVVDLLTASRLLRERIVQDSQHFLLVHCASVLCPVAPLVAAHRSSRPAIRTFCRDHGAGGLLRREVPGTSEARARVCC
jgi:predicted enzyme related to lactoylglutathione lyase